SGVSRVASIRTIVVFPAPFGPSRASTRPVSAVRSIPASASVPPNDLRTPSTSMIESLLVLMSSFLVVTGDFHRQGRIAASGCDRGRGPSRSWRALRPLGESTSVREEAVMIVVTGATGNVGRKLVAGLAADGLAVRALTRDPAAARVPPGIEAARFDAAM